MIFPFSSHFNGYSNFKLLFMLILFTSSIHLTSSYYNTGYQIRDLARTDTGFQDEVLSWMASAIRPSQVLANQCGGTWLLGGYGILGSDASPYQLGDYFSRTYNNLPTHTWIYYSFTFWEIDTWNPSDYIQVQVDNTIVSGWLGWNYLNFPGNICGASSADISNVRIFGKIAHTANYATFRMVSRFDQVSTNEAIAMRNVNLLIVSNPSSTTANLCINAPITSTMDCPCPEGQYNDATYGCTACNAACSACFGSGANQCYECSSGYSFDGGSCFQCATNCLACSGSGSNQCTACQSGYLLFNNNTCVLSSDCDYPLIKTYYSTYCESPCGFPEYVYWNQTCSVSCDAQYQQTTLFGLVKKCIYPCTNSALPYLYWSGVCLASCPLPYRERIDAGYKYCDFPCERTSDYLFANGTCSPICPYPFSPFTYYSKNRCNYLCTGTNYLYWDQTCSACPSPLISRLDGGKRFCVYPCDSDQYLYWNGSCLYTCPSPLTKTTTHSKNLCQNSCTSGYLYADGSCLAACSAPYMIRIEGGVNYCDKICTTEKPYLFEDGTCIASCNSPLQLITNTSGTYCIPPCDSSAPYYDLNSKQCLASCNNTVSVSADGLYKTCIPYYAPAESVSILKLLHYVPYLDIDLPEKLQGVSVMRATNVLSLRLDRKTFYNIKQKFSWMPPPSSVFLNSFVFSSFIANFSDDLILLAIVLGSGIIFLLLEWFAMCTECQNVQFFFERLRVLTLFNLPIMLIATNIGDIIFFSSLEFRTYDSHQPSAVVSILIAIVMLVLLGVIFLIASCLVYGAQEVKYSASNELNAPFAKYLLRWDGFQVLFRGYKDTNWFTQSFYMLYCIRVAIPMIFASFCYNAPLVQVCFYLAISILMILYLVFMKPIKKDIDHMNLLFVELILLMVNVSLLALTILDKTNSPNQTAKDFLGDVILTADFCLNILAGTALIAKIGVGAQQAFRMRKEKSPQEFSAWVQLLFLPIQQGCFGFEQVQLGRFVAKGRKSESLPYSPYSGRVELVNRNNLSTAGPYQENRNLLETTMMDQNRTFSDLGGAAGVGVGIGRGIGGGTRYNNNNNDASMDKTAESFPVNKISQRDRGNYSQLNLPNVTSDSFPIQRIAKKSHPKKSFEDF